MRIKRKCKSCDSKPKHGCFYCETCTPGMGPKKKGWEDKPSPQIMRRLIIQEYGHKCCSCNNTEWMAKPIPLEMDHIDGNSDNNNKSNLRMLCPNCHAQTPTFKALNKGRKKRYA